MASPILWKKSLILAAVLGTLHATACTDDPGGDNAGGAAGAGSGGKGGTAGSGGTSQAGTSGSRASGGSNAGTSGSGNSQGGSAGSSAGSSGANNAGTGTTSDVICDPESGDFPGTPLSTCEPDPSECNPSNSDCKCSRCLAQNCCELVKNCYASAPSNVCGFGGPDGSGEIACVQTCLQLKADDGSLSTEDRSACGSDAGGCVTAKDSKGKSCGSYVGTVTSELAGCMVDKCQDECVN